MNRHGHGGCGPISLLSLICGIGLLAASALLVWPAGIILQLTDREPEHLRHWLYAPLMVVTTFIWLAWVWRNWSPKIVLGLIAVAALFYAGVEIGLRYQIWMR